MLRTPPKRPTNNLRNRLGSGGAPRDRGRRSAVPAAEDRHAGGSGSGGKSSCPGKTGVAAAVGTRGRPLRGNPRHGRGSAGPGAGAEHGLKGRLRSRPFSAYEMETERCRACPARTPLRGAGDRRRGVSTADSGREARRMKMSEREESLLDRPVGVVAGRPGGLRAEIGRSPRPAAVGVAAACRRRTGAQPRRPFDARGDAS